MPVRLSGAGIFSQSRSHMKNFESISLCLILLLCSACGEKISPPPAAQAISQQHSNASDYIPCPEDQISVCPKAEHPVCADVDTGIRCITTPCPSTEQQTFTNACNACENPKVLGYRDGKCTTEIKNPEISQDS